MDDALGADRRGLADLAAGQAGEDDLGGIGHRGRRGAGRGAAGDEGRHGLRARVEDMQPHVRAEEPLAIGAPIWPRPRKPIWVRFASGVTMPLSTGRMVPVTMRLRREAR